jgi:hypothetical protein
VQLDETRANGRIPVLARTARIAAWLGLIALALFVLDLLGVPVGDWIRQLFKEMRAAFPAAGIRFRPVLAAYAVAVALNGFLPANIGTLVMMLMFVTLIAGATFAAILSGFVVQKIPFTVLSVAVYVYLFVTVSSSLKLELGFLSEHPVLSAVVVLAVAAVVALAVRHYWHRAAKLRDRLRQGERCSGSRGGSWWASRCPRSPASRRASGSSPCSWRPFRFRSRFTR